MSLPPRSTAIIQSARQTQHFSARLCPAETRFPGCEQRVARVRYYVDGAEVGLANLQTTMLITTKVNSNAFSATMHVEVLSAGESRRAPRSCWNPAAPPRATRAARWPAR